MDVTIKTKIGARYKLSECQQIIFEECYLNNRTGLSIATDLNLSPQFISQSMRGIRKKIGIKFFRRRDVQWHLKTRFPGLDITFEKERPAWFDNEIIEVEQI